MCSGMVIAGMVSAVCSGMVSDVCSGMVSDGMVSAVCSGMVSDGMVSDAQEWSVLCAQEWSVMLLGLSLTLGKVPQLPDRPEAVLGQQTALTAPLLRSAPLGGSGNPALVGRAGLCFGKWERVCIKAGIATAEGMG